KLRACLRGRNRRLIVACAFGARTMVDVAQNARPTVVGYPMSGVAQDARRTVGGMSDVGTLGRCLMWRKMRGALRPKSNV
ncbi:MAG: hypothetical protein VYD07_06010, partial [Pseudomonadota bacterium]|nr:hypothetical protein [Pseudomonadota bacterium]